MRPTTTIALAVILVVLVAAFVASIFVGSGGP
jgi:hypothetical protein